MYLVDEEHVVLVERGEQAGEVAGFVKDGTRCDLETHAEFVGDDVGKGGLAEAWRAVEEGVVERFAAHLGGSHEDAQVLLDLVLALEVVEGEGAKGFLELLFVGGLRGFGGFSYVEIVGHCWGCEG